MRYGLVGLGWAARSFHVPALGRVPGAVVVGGVDNSPEQRAAWERETGLPTFESLEALLERATPDVVLVATPPASHLELSLQAIAGGAHVVCEKPFVETVQEADELLAAAAAAGRQVAVNHEFREKPIFKALKKCIDSGQVGRLVFCQMWQLMDLPPWDEPVAWRAAMPNRTLFEGGVHLVDLLLFLFDAKPTAVYARHSSGLEPGRDADAIQLVTLEFPGNRLAQITIDRLCRAGTRYLEVRADCEQASLRASHGGRAYVRIGMKRAERTGVKFEFGARGIAWVEQGPRTKTLARNPRDDGVFGTAELHKRIASALEQGQEPPSSGREARNVLAVIEAAYTSGATGARVELGWEP